MKDWEKWFESKETSWSHIGIYDEQYRYQAFKARLADESKQQTTIQEKIEARKDKRRPRN